MGARGCYNKPFSFYIKHQGLLSLKNIVLQLIASFDQQNGGSFLIVCHPLDVSCQIRAGNNGCRLFDLNNLNRLQTLEILPVELS